MNITFRRANPERRDFAYWKDVAFGGVGAVCIVAGIGHFLDWSKERNPIDWQIGLSFLAAFGIILLLSRRRFEFVLISLSVIVVCGTVNAIVSRSLVGLPIIAPCAILAYFMVRHKSHASR
jgi:hypothetical protein